MSEKPLKNDLSGLPPHLHGSCKIPEPPMLPSEYQALAARTECDQRRALARMAGLKPVDTSGLPESALLAIRLNHGVLGLTGEVGELAGAIERWVYYGKELDKENVAEEIGDCCWYLALLCNAGGFNLGAILKANIAKLKARYPEKYTDEAAANRDLDAEMRARAAAMRSAVEGTLHAVESAELGERFLAAEKACQKVTDQIEAATIGNLKSPAGTAENPHKHETLSAPAPLGSERDPVEEFKPAILPTDKHKQPPRHPSHNWVQRPGMVNLYCSQCGGGYHLGGSLMPCVGAPVVNAAGGEEAYTEG